MEYLWIIILIAGAIMSSVQKEQQKKKRRPEHTADPTDVSETDLGQEWERRMRDIFPQPLSIPAPQVRKIPATISDTQSVNPDHPLAQAMARQSVSAERAAIQKPKSRKKNAKTAGSAKQQPIPTVPAAPKTACPNADYGRIIDEFDLERAVIYSEILKPKFEEY